MAGIPRLSLPFSRHRLREIRRRKGLTQAALAQICVSNGHPMERTIISRLERGEFGPTPERLTALAEALDVTVDDLLAAEEENTNDDPIILDKYEAARRLGIGVGTLEKAAQERSIPFTWRGRAYGWTLEQLLEIARLWEERPAGEHPSTPTSRGSARGARRARRIVA